MVAKNVMSFARSLGVTTLLLAASVSAEEPGPELTSRLREPKRWNVSFVYGGTSFAGTEGHQTLGGSFRVRLSERFSVEPEFRYMSWPTSSFESALIRRETKHSDILVAGHVVYDFRNEAGTRFVPYVTGGVGWGQTRDDRRLTRNFGGGDIPVFPAPPPPETTTTRTADDWLWLGAGFGMRVRLFEGFFVSPEVNFGASPHEGIVSAVIKAGYGF